MSYVALSLALAFFEVEPPREGTVQDALCLTEAVHYEANGEDWDGKVAIAFVMGKRTDLRYFPNSYCGVLKDAGQLSHRDAGLSLADVTLTEPGDLRSFDETMDVVLLYMEGRLDDPTEGADHFYNPDLVSNVPTWAQDPISVVDIGNHRFIQVYP